MAIPAWPETLPYIPTVNGTGPQTLYQAPLRTEMEDGPVRQRRRSTATWSAVALRFRMTNAQYQTFKDFVTDTLNHGASRFTMPVWQPGATEPIPVKTVQLTGDPVVEALGPVNFVSLPLSVLDL